MSCRILFICTGNSARSIMAEAIMRSLGRDHIAAFSAGSHATGFLHPMAVARLKAEGIDDPAVRSKSWAEFTQSGAPAMDVVITLCSDAATEPHPVWPGDPATLDWPVADPSRLPAAWQEQGFARLFETLSMALSGIVALPLSTMDRADLARHLRAVLKPVQI